MKKKVLGTLDNNFALAKKAYEDKIKTFSRNSYYVVPFFTPADMEQELLLVLWNCVFEYHPRNGATFNTFWTQCARNRIVTLSRASLAIKRQSESWLDKEIFLKELEIENREYIDDIEYLAASSDSAEDVAMRRINMIEEYIDRFSFVELEEIVLKFDKETRKIG